MKIIYKCLRVGFFYLSIFYSFNLVTSSFAQANADTRIWKPVGNALFTWGIWDIYQSQLLTLTGQFDPIQYKNNQQPILLRLEYLRDIQSKNLLKATLEQWSHLGIPAPKIEQWAKNMQSKFPDIHEGDRLYYFFDGQRGQFFYQKTNSTPYLYAEVTDPEQAKAMIDIWLSPKTEYPKLREKLITPNQ